VIPSGNSYLVTCDGGGSNPSRHYIFKADLQALADEIGIEIRIAHYPPYCSKYNPIEHRLFPHVTRACQGVVFTSIEIVKELMEKTHTETGLRLSFISLTKSIKRDVRYLPTSKKLCASLLTISCLDGTIELFISPCQMGKLFNYHS